MTLDNNEIAKRWTGVLQMSSAELLDHLMDFYDTDHGLTPESPYSEILEYVVYKHHPEFQECLKAYLATTK